MANPVTQHFGLAYPDPANQTNEEFQRLILMIQALDLALRNLQIAIESKSDSAHDHQISGVQGLQGELTSLQTSIAALQAPTLASLTDVDVNSAANGNVLLHLAGDWQSAFLAAANVTYGAGSVEDALDNAATSAAMTAALNGKLDTTGTAADSSKLGNVAAANYMRKDVDQVISAHTRWSDQKQVQLGDDNDLRLFHDSANSLVDSHTGNLYFRSFMHGGHMYFQGEDASGTMRQLLHLVAGNTMIGFCEGIEKFRTVSTGLSVSGDVNSTSDRRLKTNLEPVTGALQKLIQLTGYTFEWKETGLPSMGLVAQEVQTVFPEAVTIREGGGNEPDRLNLAYSNLVAPIVEALKEIHTRLGRLEAAHAD